MSSGRDASARGQGRSGDLAPGSVRTIGVEGVTKGQGAAAPCSSSVRSRCAGAVPLAGVSGSATGRGPRGRLGLGGAVSSVPRPSSNRTTTGRNVRETTTRPRNGAPPPDSGQSTREIGITRRWARGRRHDEGRLLAPILARGVGSGFHRATWGPRGSKRSRGGPSC